MAKQTKLNWIRRVKQRESACFNCHAEVDTAFCPHCGQENTAPDLTVAGLIRDFCGELLFYDSKLWRTLRVLILNPGTLTQQWVAGKRASFLSPFRLYLGVSFLFFLIASYVTPNVMVDSKNQPVVIVGGYKAEKNHKPSNWFETQMQKIERASDGEKGALPKRIVGAFPTVLFAMLPLFAVALRCLIWRHRYVEHLVFALHVHAFAFLVLLIPNAFVSDWPKLIPLIWLPIYAVCAMRKFYGQSWPVTIVKSFALGFVYLLLLTAGSIGALLIVTMQMP